MPRALSALLIGVLLLTARAPGSALAQMPPPDDPPYKHFLSTDEEKRVTDQGKKINELLAADKCAEALTLAREVLALRTRQQGAKHWQTVRFRRFVEGLEKIATLSAADQADYAECCRLMLRAAAVSVEGKADEAEAMYDKALGIQRRLLGEESLDSAGLLATVGALQAKRGLVADGDKHLRKALAIRERVLGPDHPDLGETYSVLAGIAYAVGNHAEAEHCNRKALAITQHSFGEEHVNTARAYDNLAVNLNTRGRILNDKDRYKEAQELLEKALPIFLRLQGEDHQDTMTCRYNMAMNLLSLDRCAEAEKLFRQTLEYHRRKNGENNPQTLLNYNNLCATLIKEGNEAGASEILYRKALGLCRATQGEDHPDVAACCLSLADNLQGQKRYAEAEPLYRQALAIRRKARGEEHADTAAAYTALEDCLKAQGKTAEAEEMLRKANRK